MTSSMRFELADVHWGKVCSTCKKIGGDDEEDGGESFSGSSLDCCCCCCCCVFLLLTGIEDDFTLFFTGCSFSSS